ncbi:hypothetical protein A1Q2_08521 (mitochondrion) [Trichosporon asahii var. asahii CBS 8904]|uniref:Uncharacterized protein n=1 Tax=Trichosporon asahii var. asahii (strain CBS 8904) TaxID=1220162 RepID=K1W5Z6_TRIAC|nr:hypothetical protein A1Q2_08521 [Trichosporon asahii var. asahii CBS 8904]
MRMVPQYSSRLSSTLIDFITLHYIQVYYLFLNTFQFFL